MFNFYPNGDPGLKDPTHAIVLVRAECVRQRNEVGIILGIIFSLSLSVLFAFLQETVILGLHKFAWAPNSQKYWNSLKQQKIRPMGGSF